MGAPAPARSFELKPAVREATPLLLGFVGPSGGGKTFSALRMATGIQRVLGGEIALVDTEAKRGLHYAELFRFQHLAFEAPFGSLDYLAAIEHCVRKGAKVIVVDSASHEHDGPGGMLEQHEEAIRSGKKDPSAWIALKANRRRMINRILQIPAAFLFCFRAKAGMHWPTQAEKDKGQKEPTRKGWEPIGAGELVFEMAAKFLLLPAADGHPTWQPQYEEEKQMVKRPLQFRALFDQHRQLSEDLGEAMARWAAGAPVKAAAPAVDVGALVARLEAADDQGELGAVKAELKTAWKSIGKNDRDAITQAVKMAEERLATEPGADG